VSVVPKLDGVGNWASAHERCADADGQQRRQQRDRRLTYPISTTGSGTFTRVVPDLPAGAPNCAGDARAWRIVHGQADLRARHRDDPDQLRSDADGERTGATAPTNPQTVSLTGSGVVPVRRCCSRRTAGDHAADRLEPTSPEPGS